MKIILIFLMEGLWEIKIDLKKLFLGNSFRSELDKLLIKNRMNVKSLQDSMTISKSKILLYRN